jgi:hypothetical protein
VCLNLAEIKKIKLKYGFWNDGGDDKQKDTTNWKTYYRFQIRLAYQLTKIYSPTSVVKALTDKSVKIYTLRDKRLDAVIKLYYDKENIEKKEIEVKEIETFGQKSSTQRSKLRDL